MKKIFTKQAFTLVELLIVMSILGILVTIVAGGFRSAQLRGRDAARKSDLKNIASSLELFNQDHTTYPAETNGKITGCPFTLSGGTPCQWGNEFTDGNTVYMKTLPIDPDSGSFYVYKIVSGSNNLKFQLFARLENTKDGDCIGGDCENPPVSVSCGAGLCNFAITSSNTSPLE